jgi:hypothetical protein
MPDTIPRLPLQHMQTERKINSRVCRPDARKWVNPTEEEENVRVAPELAFEDTPAPRREEDEDEAGTNENEADVGQAYARRRLQWERATTRCGCPTRTRRFRDHSTSSVFTSSSIVVVFFVAVIPVLGRLETIRLKKNLYSQLKGGCAVEDIAFKIDSTADKREAKVGG